MMWQIEFYETPPGRCPVEEFLKGLPEAHLAKVMRLFNLLEQHGIQVRKPHVADITGIPKLKELRIKAHPNIYRVFFFAHTGRKFVMLHAFVKKTQKTPKREIRLAKERMDDYLSRSGE